MSTIDNLPPLYEVLKKYGINAKRKLGQNFLLDLNLTTRIARQAGNIMDNTVIEVGAGPGCLTRSLLALGVNHIIAIEKDSRCIPALEEISRHYPDKMTIIHDDAMKVDYINLLKIKKLNKNPVKIVANLPYNIATPLITRWLTYEDWPPFYGAMVLMFQKEVAQRLCASPNQKSYGRLSVLANWRTKTKMMFDVKNTAFIPPPRVTSSVVQMTVKLNPVPCKVNNLEYITRMAFGKRRKMLRSSLKMPDREILFDKTGIDSSKRAEQISFSDYVNLANLMDCNEF